MPQLTINEQRIHNVLSLEMPRGDDKWIEGTDGSGVVHDLQASEVQEVAFTVRNASAMTIDGVDYAAGTALIELTSDAQSTQFVYSTDYRLLIKLLAADTVGLPPGPLYTHGIQIIDNSDRVYTPYTGPFSLIDDVVHDDETAAFTTRTTRSTFETALSGLLACSNATLTTAAASLGASAVVVADPSLFTATDSAVFALDGGGYDTHTILSVSSYTLNLDGTTLSAAMAVGNVVQKKG